MVYLFWCGLFYLLCMEVAGGFVDLNLSVRLSRRGIQNLVAWGMVTIPVGFDENFVHA